MELVLWFHYSAIISIKIHENALIVFPGISFKMANAYSLLFTIRIARNIKAHTAQNAKMDSTLKITHADLEIGTVLNLISNHRNVSNVLTDWRLRMGYVRIDLTVITIWIWLEG